MSAFAETVIIILLGLIFMALLNIDKSLVDLGQIIKGMMWRK